MKIAVTGASGNLGTSVIEACQHHPEIDEIVGISRRRPTWSPAKTRWVEADVTSSDLTAAFEGAGAVIHLAWAIQPSHDEALLESTNVEGTRKVFQAAVRAGVGRILYASSVGAYSSGPVDRRVDEDWPTRGVGKSTYSRQKAAVEADIDRFESLHPDVSVVRFRPGLIFKGEAASAIRRLFAGPFLPTTTLGNRLLRRSPFLKGLRFQAVHSSDVGEAFARAAVGEVTGAFNLAADPPIGPDEVSEVLGAPPACGSPDVARFLARIAWKARVQPSEPGWVDLAMESPLMDTRRARDELGWQPRMTSLEAMGELVEGIRQGEGHSSPHLGRSVLGQRVQEIKTAVGGRPWVRSRQEQVRIYLNDVHSIEQQALIQMRFAPRLVGSSELVSPFQDHCGETREHASRVRQRLFELGGGPSDVKDRAGVAGGLAMLLFARTQPDTPGKLVAHAYSYEHMELAAYEILAAYAERCGDGETASVARQIASQERAMAWHLEEHFGAAARASVGGEAGAERSLEAYLQDARAIESQGDTLLRTVRRFVDDRALQTLLDQAGDLVSTHRSRLAATLAAWEAKPSTVKEAVLSGGGRAGAHFLGQQPDPNTKVAGFVFAYLHLQVASYELLARVASLAGQDEVIATAGVGADESRALADQVTDLWDHLGGV